MVNDDAYVTQKRETRKSWIKGAIRTREVSDQGSKGRKRGWILDGRR